MKKRLSLIIISSILLIILTSNVIAVQGTCVSGTCTCDGKTYFTCPCNSDPCKLCKPGDPIFEHYKCSGSGSTNNHNQNIHGQVDQNTQQVQQEQPIDLEKGFSIGMQDIKNGLINWGRMILGKPAIINGQVQGGSPTTSERVIAIIAALAALGFSGLFLNALLSKILGFSVGQILNRIKDKTSKDKEKQQKNQTNFFKKK